MPKARVVPIPEYFCSGAIGTVYLIHIDQPIGHVRTPEERELHQLPPRKSDKPHYIRHYIGFALDLEKRLKMHRKNKGAKILAFANHAGIGWQVARTWENVDQRLEGELKSQKNAAKLCPICKKEKEHGA